MKNDEMREFSWSTLFVVTACCSFLFNGALKLPYGIISDLLLIVGGIAISLAVMNWTIRIIAWQASKKRRSRRIAP